MRYRPEIDGLRAVAVVPVILFHAGFGRVSGGFVGVDVFFVISGFLITSILLAEHAEGRFSLRRFYERRARRILPALYVVLAACVPMAARHDDGGRVRRLLPRPRLGRPLRLQLLAAGRSPATSSPRPTTTRSSTPGASRSRSSTTSSSCCSCCSSGAGGRGRCSWGIGLLSVASLALAEVGWRHWPEANFFLLPSRAWELGAGSLVAALAFGRGPRQGRAPLLAELAAAAGLAAILAVESSLFDARTPLPGLYAWCRWPGRRPSSAAPRAR